MKQINNIFTKLFQFKFLIIQLLVKNVLIINAIIKPKGLSLQRTNLGDDLNFVIPKLISSKRVIPYYLSILSLKRKDTNIMCIGSIIPWCVNRESLIWGSGAISNDLELKIKPQKVLAVRGPLTRDYLINHGVECPEIYGDPALLLSRYYHPVIQKKYKIGIIPHVVDKGKKVLDSYLKIPEVTILDIEHYNHWKNFINKLCECEMILSSSLHGLILADAFGIPNNWIELSNDVMGNGFKFRDYFMSVKRPVIPAYKIDRYIDIDLLYDLRKKWTTPQIDLEKLLAVCPF